MTITDPPVVLPPNADLIIRFSRPIDAQDVARWIDDMASQYPGRRIIALESGTEFHIQSKSARTTNRLLMVGVAVLIADLTVRAIA